ncbi:MAG: hypothetical protein QOE45_1013 [Frankiaceae bacterium]|nr:hypothetical protein [Frankiaceae bacterium]
MSSQLVTGEAVALDLRPARLPSRMLAALIDLAIEFVAFGLVMQLLTIAVVLSDPAFGAALTILVLVAFFIGYPVAFESLWRGLTPGKAALGIRVVRDDGGPIRFRHALTRAIFNVVERPGITLGAGAVIASLLSSKGKRIGDLVAGTFVVRERVPRQQMLPAFMPPQLAHWATSLDLSRLPDDLALAARGFLGRASQLRPDARERLGSELAAAVAAAVTPPPPPGTPGWAYLSAVVAERRRRDEARMPAAYRPSAWQPAAPSPGWGPAPPAPTWAASAPPVGAPPGVGPPPRVGPPPAVPGPPRMPAAPSPQWGPPPVPPPIPPLPHRPSGAPVAVEPPVEQVTEGGFALPG